MLWRVDVAASCLAIDPFTHLAAAFVHSEQGEELCECNWVMILPPVITYSPSVVYVVDPGNPQPLAVHSLPSGTQTVVGGAFVPRTLDTKKLKSLVVGESSTLFFITKDQVSFGVRM